MPSSCSKYVVASMAAVVGLGSPASGLSGQVVNRLSGKCLDVSDAGDKVQLYTCDNAGSNTDQLWELTADGFLKNTKSSKFLDFPGDNDGAVAKLAARVSHDPFTIKQWELTSDGHLKNLLNGKCLDVQGTPGTQDGSPLQLWACDNAASNTDQLWKFLAAPERAQQPKFRGYVVNRLSGKCLDVTGTGASSKIQLYTCPGSSTDQLWELTADGFLRNVRSDQCLDLEGASANSAGAGAMLSACESANSQTDQRWELTADGHFRNLLNGKCLDVYGVPGTEDGSRLQLWKCEDASSNTDQLWVFFSTITHLPPKFHGYVVSRLSGKCLDVVGPAGSANGNKVQLLGCDTAAANTDQVWELTADGFLRNVQHQQCLDLEGASATEDGTSAKLGPCESPSSKTDQMWELTPEGQFRNLLNGKCLDVYGTPGTEDGSHLQLLTCEAATGNSDQLWVFMATPPLARALIA